MAQHYYSSTAVATALATAITTTTGLQLVVPDVAGDNGWPTSFPFTLAIDYGTVGVELVDVTSKGSLSGGNRTWNITRGIDFTIASTHAVGATVRHVIAARDFVEARQARSLQPVDTENSLITRESTGGTQFLDSSAGDFIVKAKSGSLLLLGVDGAGPSESTAQVSGTEMFVNGQLTAGKGPGAFRRGNAGAAFGTNYGQVWRTSNQTIVANTWTTVVWNQHTEVTDDGNAWDGVNSFLTFPGTGFFVGTFTAGFPSLGSGFLRVVRHSDQAVLCVCAVSSGLGTLAWASNLPNTGHDFQVNVNVTSILANATATPLIVRWAQVA